MVCMEEAVRSIYFNILISLEKGRILTIESHEAEWKKFALKLN